MSSLTFPTIHTINVNAHARPAWPWKPAILLFVLFAMAGWSWSASQRWYASDAGDVDAMVDRIAEGQILRQVAFALMGVYGVWALLAPAERPTRLKLFVFYPLLVFVAWAMLSTVWSVDRSMTMKRLVVFVSMGVTIVSVLRRYDIREIAQIAFLASLLTALCGSVNELRILLTDFPGFGRWRFGGTMHPNHAGLNCCILMLSSLYLFRHSKQKGFLVSMAFALFLLFATKSRTALMSGVTGGVVFMLLATSGARALWALMLTAWLIGAAMWLSSMQMLPDVNSILSMGRDDLKKADVRQLTGRTDIWKFALMQGARDPNRSLVGYGYETFWTADNARGVSQFVKFKISEGHNVYLDWYLELGIVGAALYVLLLVMTLGRWAVAAKMLGSPAAALCAATLAAALVHGFAESSTGDASLPTFFVYAAIAGAALRRPDEEEVV
jgi:O-antigen ligase